VALGGRDSSGLPPRDPFPKVRGVGVALTVAKACVAILPVAPATVSRIIKAGCPAWGRV
jgi:hypothetical protein